MGDNYQESPLLEPSTPLTGSSSAGRLPSPNKWYCLYITFDEGVYESCTFQELPEVYVVFCFILYIVYCCCFFLSLLSFISFMSLKDLLQSGVFHFRQNKLHNNLQWSEEEKEIPGRVFESLEKKHCSKFICNWQLHNHLFSIKLSQLRPSV